MPDLQRGRVDCELIIPQKRKRGCENCKRRKKVIYSYLRDAREPPSICPANSVERRAYSASRDRPDLNKKARRAIFRMTYRKKKDRRMLVHLTEDIQPLSIAADVNDSIEDSGRHGNFKISSANAHIDERKAFLLDILSKPWKPPTSSTPKESQKSPTATATATKEEIKTETEQNQTSEKENTLTRQQQKKLEKSSTGIVRIITTSFAHPINFAYEPTSPKDKPCHFCTDFTYGMLGLGEVKVEVIDYRDRQLRLRRDRRRAHRRRSRTHPDGYDPESFDYAAAFATLEPSTTTTTTPTDGSSGDGGTPVLQNPWCMLCPNPAFFGCITTQSLNKFQEPVTPSPDAVGCGLLLCANCAGLMQIPHCDVAKVVKRNRERDGQDGDQDIVMLEARTQTIVLTGGSD
ncbi:hypothetical protein VTN00DRAFT_6644 [Thermoascus crustaceus]|uniref:uncharacterized protein n=1 Tax=Thermoascus crustaceus TaxID=5088 RepID=UPI0037442F88